MRRQAKIVHQRNGKRRPAAGLLLLTLLICASMLALAGCGEEEQSQEEPTSFEVAMITDSTGVDDGSFRQNTWEGIQSFCEESGTTCQYYVSKEDTDDSYIEAVRTARDAGAKICVFAGSQFETTVHTAQQEFEDLYFVLIDGVPRDSEYNYELAANSTGVLFAEEQAGYLAGYAAVCDGYTKLGFVGGKDLPAVKRYGAGFVQGISAAAKDRGLQGITVKYVYSGTFEASKKIEKAATAWYEDGTEVIFACGGAIGESVIAAADGGASEGKGSADEEGDAAEDSGSADKNDADAGSQDAEGAEGAPAGIGKVIGVDTDQSAMSPNVITSAKKRLDVAVTDLLKTYIHNSFKGNSIFNYTIENNGISLEMENSRFNSFTQADYDTLMQEIKTGKRSVSKEALKGEISSLAGGGVTVEEIPQDKFMK